MIFYQLTRPASYLTIKDPSKWKMDWGVPLFLTIGIACTLYFLPNKVSFYGKNGIMPQLQSFLQMLPGFYLAALAAIATFNKKDLDFYLPNPTPEIITRMGSQYLYIKLTRRRMLCYLFGYLTFLSLILYLASVFGSVLSVNLATLVSNYKEYVISGLKFFFIFFFFQMIIITIFGLYQLCDRIHQPDNNST